jgi:RHS repeat-associated protein
MNPLSKNNIIETRYYINGYELYKKENNGVVDFERKTINISDDEKVFVRIEQKAGENPVVRYQYDNHLGSACLELDNTGQIISYEEYNPFGTTSYRSGRNQTEVSLKRYKYCGKERDEETGLYYYGARYYAGWIGRWISTDPLKEKYLNLTPYNYCLNNPIILTDPDGRRPDPPFGIRLGFNLGLGSNGLNFNVTASVGVEHRTPNFQAVVFASASVYGGQQLGTSFMTRGPQFDVTAGAYATIGKGIGSPHNFYTLNYNTASPFNNTFDISFTYGQARTYNSAINTYGDGPGWQTQGIIGFRLGENFSVSSNNDSISYGTGFTNKYLFGDKGSDAGWTGGIVLNIGGIEMGYQNFSGYWEEFGTKGKVYGYIFSAENRAGGNGAYHQNLNRAFNFVRKGNVTIGVFSGAWLQNWIHKYVSDDGTYIYNNQGNVNITV